MSGSASEVNSAESGTRRLSLAAVSVVFGASMLSLLGFQQALRLSGGQGIEDLLGWEKLESLMAAVQQWCGSADTVVMGIHNLRWHIASVYLLVDTFLFMPLYAVLLLLAGARLRQALRPGQSTKGVRLRRWLWPVAVVAVLAVLLLDALENHGGALRIGLSPALFWACLACGVALGAALWLWCTHPRGAVRRAARGLVFTAFTVAGLLVLQSFFGASPLACTDPGKALTADTLGAVMHRAKGVLVMLAVLPVLLAALLWLFGGELDRGQQLGERGQRAAMRSGAAAIIGRTRYVLVALALFGGLTLGLDQCRDVLLGLAKWPTRQELATAHGWWGLLMLVGTAVAIGLFVYSTWLWARLACRVKRLGADATPQIADVARRAPDPKSDPVRLWLGNFARVWARFLSIVPLLCVYALIAYALSDAILAADGTPSGAHDTTETVLMLVLFGAGAVGMGVGFLLLRGRLALRDRGAYYNQVADVHVLLRAQDTPVRQQELTGPPQKLLGLLRWLTPRMLPLAALGLMVLLRVSVALAPQLAASAPAALALVALTLTWWIGVFGALALVEQAQARPYVLVGVAIVGVLTLMGVSDNHVLPWALPLADETTLHTLRLQNAALLALLAGLAAAMWLLVTHDLEDSRVPGWLRRWGRLKGAVLVALLAVGGLHLFDRLVPVAQEADTVAAPAALASRPHLQQALQQWAGQLPAALPGQEQVFLVASEGGGIRSAYWTAQVLRQLRKQFPDFDRRTFALSGVSGGAVGAAAYSACLRQGTGAPTDDALDTCLKQGFGQLDALSPLLATWMFEDGLARVLPTPMGPRWYQCQHPACGHLSRALGFEREWLRAFPALAQPIQAVRPGEPHLLLNSTWVESGERAVAASLSVDEQAFPGARDVQARLGAKLNLMGAAHVAARFPFINPLAAVLPAPGAANAPEKGLAGHLTDGGYFDNSGAISMANVWHAMKTVLEDTKTKRQPLLVLIRNGQKTAACERPDPKGPPADCIAPRKTPLADPAELDKAVIRRSWGLYADVLGPAVAVLNVSGIGSHGRLAAADLRGELGEPQASGRNARVLIIDQLDEGTLVPLGWYLSAPARQALDQQADCLSRKLHDVYTSAAARDEPCR